jgi:hypothetical protein
MEEEERLKDVAGQDPARSWLEGEKKRRGENAESTLISTMAMMTRGRRNFMVVTVRLHEVLARRIGNGQW